MDETGNPAVETDEIVPSGKKWMGLKEVSESKRHTQNGFTYLWNVKN